MNGRDRIDPLAEYAERLSGPVPAYLEAVERATFLRTVAPQMISGRLQGRVLAMLSRLLRPQRILEIGTFTGYGSLCLAEGLAEGGTLYTIEGDPESASLAGKHFARSPYAGRITILEGEAVPILADLKPSFDLIYLDADKRSYPAYFPQLKRLLSVDGLLLADNVCWDGKTVDQRTDPVAEAIDRYNELILSDSELEVVILPLRDGLSVARRVK